MLRCGQAAQVRSMQLSRMYLERLGLSVTHGGRRPGAGQPPKYGAAMTERMGLVLTEAERAEIEAAIPDGDPVGRWIVEAALARARAG